MKKLILFLKRCKKGFSLMECVCAIAVVGLISAMILPLVAGAMRSFRASDALREVAAEAAKKDATEYTNKNKKTFYVTVSYNIYPRMQAESLFVFTESTASDDMGYGVQVTYYNLKYTRETEDPS